VLPVERVPVQVAVVVLRSVVIALLLKVTVAPVLVGILAVIFKVTPAGIPSNVNLTAASLFIVAPAN
jgi:hypothetical protein